MLVVTKNQAKAKAQVLHKFLVERGVDLPASDMLNAIARMAGFEDWNGLSAQFQEKALNSALHDHEQMHAIACLESGRDSGGENFGKECCIQTASGFWMVLPAYPAEVDYVRVCDPAGREIVYWSVDEFTEDAACVLAALAGALNRGRGDKKPDPFNPVADKITVADRPARNSIKKRKGLAEISWTEVEDFTFEISEVVNGTSFYRRCPMRRYPQQDVLVLLDKERNGIATSEDIAELDARSDELVFDWGDDFEEDGLSVSALRGLKHAPAGGWQLRDGRLFTILQLTTVE